jgi:hypothetical protein
MNTKIKWGGEIQKGLHVGGMSDISAQKVKHFGTSF